MSKIACVVPTCRPESHAAFVKAWSPLFEKHKVTLVTVWDGEDPNVKTEIFENGYTVWRDEYPASNFDFYKKNRDLFCRFTDACRNIGFVVAAQLGADYILTLDDDVEPLGVHLNSWERDNFDSIQSHLDVLQKRVPLGWMNTAHNTDLYLRGVPYKIRDEAPVMLSHGVWVGTPDFDGETQLKLEQNKWTTNPNRDPLDYLDGERHGGVPHTLPYYVGPIPKGVYFPLCGMNVMVKREALGYLYFAPMGPDCGVEGLNRFSDIWMGISLKTYFDSLGWAVYTGGSTVHHTRASNAQKNYEQEKLGREWNETADKWIDNPFSLPDSDPKKSYAMSYVGKRGRFRQLIEGIYKKG